MKPFLHILSVVGPVMVTSALVACSSSTPTTTADGGTDSGASTRPLGVDCGRKTCPQEPDVTPAQVQACEDAASGPCSTEYKVAYACITPKIACGTDGKVESSAALAAVNDCAKELKAYNTCAGPADGGAGD